MGSLLRENYTITEEFSAAAILASIFSRNQSQSRPTEVVLMLSHHSERLRGRLGDIVGETALLITGDTHQFVDLSKVIAVTALHVS